MRMTEEQRRFLFDNGQGAVGLWNLALPLRNLPPADSPLIGYHVLMTEPYHYANPEKDFVLSETSLLAAELSARLWHRYNGPICMVTDPRGYSYLRALPIARAYDEILPILDPRNHGILPTRYWAAGKLQALKLLPAPCTLVDMDLMLWEPLQTANEKLVCSHIEHLYPTLYPPQDFFKTSYSYQFPAEWDFTQEPLNTSLLYIADKDFQDYYATESIRFMCAEKETPDYLATCMIFAEQRILAMCAAAKGIDAALLMDYDHLLAPQRRFTHIWSAKRLIDRTPALKELLLTLYREKLRQLC